MMETQALVELMREGNKVLKGTGDRYLAAKNSQHPSPPPKPRPTQTQRKGV